MISFFRGRLVTEARISTLVIRVLRFTICSWSVHEKGKIGDYDEAVERKEAKRKRAPPGAGASGSKLSGRTRRQADSEYR